MNTSEKYELEQGVLLNSRDYEMNTVLFRQVIGEALGINATDMECLDILFHKKIATASDLGMHTGLSSGATTAMLDRLEKNSFIERRPNPKDRRGTLIVLTDEANQKVSPLLSSIKKAQNELISKYSEEELQLLTNFFKTSTEIWEVERKKLKQSLKK